MTDAQMNILGAYILGAVYLGAAVTVGLIWGDVSAVIFALASAGLGYLCQIAGALDVMTFGALKLRGIALALWAVSLLAGIASGASLLSVVL